MNEVFETNLEDSSCQCSTAYTPASFPARVPNSYCDLNVFLKRSGQLNSRWAEVISLCNSCDDLLPTAQTCRGTHISPHLCVWTLKYQQGAFRRRDNLSHLKWHLTRYKQLQYLSVEYSIMTASMLWHLLVLGHWVVSGSSPCNGCTVEASLGKTWNVFSWPPELHKT